MNFTSTGTASILVDGKWEPLGTVENIATQRDPKAEAMPIKIMPYEYRSTFTFKSEMDAQRVVNEMARAGGYQRIQIYISGRLVRPKNHRRTPHVKQHFRPCCAYGPRQKPIRHSLSEIRDHVCQETRYVKRWRCAECKRLHTERRTVTFKEQIEIDAFIKGYNLSSGDGA